VIIANQLKSITKIIIKIIAKIDIYGHALCMAIASWSGADPAKKSSGSLSKWGLI
jgi:hypothetical protein